nr:MAG TPA: hypothetical protein [Caudoviricetes sp.]
MKIEGSKYRLINYFDVWGNEEDGYEVNDLCVEETGIFIADDSTDQEVLNLLVRIGFLTTDDPEKVCVINNGDMIEIESVEDGCPLGRLEREFI